MFSSLTTRLIVPTISLLVAGIFLYTAFNIHRQKDMLISNARENIELLLHTVESSMYSTMHVGKTQDVGKILSRVGEHHDLVGVRIFNHRGIVMHSTVPSEVGKSVHADDFRIYQGNKNYGIFTLPKHGEVMSMVKRIYNEVPCHACHDSKASILGVLNVDYSLNRTETRIYNASRIFVYSSVSITVFLAITISFLLVRFVKRPLDTMVSTMQKVEKGDFTARIEYSQNDDIGRLIISFNSMLDQLYTAQKGLEQIHFEQLEKADRLASIGEMAAGIAHEIKNPLAGISAAVTIIKKDMSPDDFRHGILGEVVEQVKRLDKTLNDLLFFGKPTIPEPTLVDINAVLTTTLKFAAQHRGSGNIELHIKLQPDLPPIYADNKQLQQVFLNIVLNAKQAMQSGGLLSITTSLTFNYGIEYVRVKISDTGPGIPLHILNKIFTPFFTTKAQGTGLGLAICDKLVKQHNGNISVTSNDLGTAFTIDLPLYNPETTKLSEVSI